MTHDYRILTLNCDEPLLHLLSRTGHMWYAGMWKKSLGGLVGWDGKIRPQPENVTVLNTPRDAIRGMEERKFDLVICPGLEYLSFLKDFSLPLVLVFSHSLPALARLRGTKASSLREEVHRWLTLRRGLFVTTSPWKYETWKVEGEVVPPGLVEDDYSGWTGDIAKALVAGDLVKEHDYLTGYGNLRRLLTHFPWQVMGHNPALPQSFLSIDWEDRKKQFRAFRLYGCGLQMPYEDGYDMGVLEAMATGMPVVSQENPTSPVRDGVDGFISSDTRYLRLKIRELLENRELALELGASARRRAIELFPVEKALDGWKRAFAKAVEKFHSREPVRPKQECAQARPRSLEITNTPTREETEALLEAIASPEREWPSRQTPAPGKMLPLAGVPRSVADTLLRFSEPGGQAVIPLPECPEATREAAPEPPSAIVNPLQKEFLAFIPPDARSILDVGCGTGALGEELKRHSIREIVGIEGDRQRARQASLVLDEVVHGDIEAVKLEDRSGYFDCILYYRTLHYLKDPWRMLQEHWGYLREGGLALVSFRNVRYWERILDLMRGSWTTDPQGFPGNTLHLFTLKDMTSALSEAGYTIEEISAFPGADTPDRQKLEVALAKSCQLSKDLLEETRIRSYHVKARKPSLPGGR